MGELKDQFSLNLGNPNSSIPHLTRATYSFFLYFPTSVILLKIFGFNLNLPLLVNFIGSSCDYFLPIFLFISDFILPCHPINSEIQMDSFCACSRSRGHDPGSINFSRSTDEWDGIFYLSPGPSILVEGKKLIDKKNFWITILFVFLLFSVKPNSTPLVLLLLLLKPAQFFTRRRMVLFWLSISALFIVVVGGWTLIQFQAEAARRGMTETQTAGIFTLILADPLRFIADLARYVVTNLPTVFQQYIAAFGYGYYTMPTAVYILFLISLGAGILHDWQLEAFSKSTRILLGFYVHRPILRHLCAPTCNQTKRRQIACALTGSIFYPIHTATNFQCFRWAVKNIRE